METVAVIQARMGSNRLPGKMMLPLAGRHVIERVIERTAAAQRVDQVIVATSDRQADDILDRYAQRAGIETVRGDETDVLGRVYRAVEPIEPDIVVRMCGDRPLFAPAITDAVVSTLTAEDADYASNTIERTFPWGWGCEAFTFESFERVEKQAESTHDREHVTPYYYNNPELFDIENVASEAVFDADYLQNRTNLRLTLDEADDYELIRDVYRNIDAESLGPDTLDGRAIIEFLDDHDELRSLNAHLLH